MSGGGRIVEFGEERTMLDFDHVRLGKKRSSRQVYSRKERPVRSEK